MEEPQLRMASCRTIPCETGTMGPGLWEAKVFADQMCCGEGSGRIFPLRVYHRRMPHFVVAIPDINMGRLADVSHRNILAVGAEGIFAAGA